MIPRTLVPRDVRPVSPDELKKLGRRTTTYMDDRTVVPSELSDAPPLDGKTTIPTHLPLGVLINRTLVDRSMPVKPLENAKPYTEFSIPQGILNSRVVVPAYVETPVAEDRKEFERAPQMTAELREIVEPDVFTTGDANLLIQPEEKKNAKSDAAVRTISLIVHIGIIILLIFPPDFLRSRPPTQAELDLARKQLSFVYMPPEGPTTPAPPTPKIHITPKTLTNVTPPRETALPPVPQPAPQPAAKDLPEAPRPQMRPSVDPQPAQPVPTAPSHLEPIEPPKSSSHPLNLGIDQSSPGRAIQEQIDKAAHQNGGQVYTSPPTGGGVPRQGGGGARGPGMGEGLTILTPTDGVNFDDYLQRVLASVKRNWFAIMPESAYMGDKGIVALTFCINTDGAVPVSDPNLERTSGKEPLDNAAMSAIRASSPFEPLPSQFKRPCLELRFIFFYNINPNSAQ
jgi:outer membrane biosynthesis protein TonB